MIGYGENDVNAVQAAGRKIVLIGSNEYRQGASPNLSNVFVRKSLANKMERLDENS